ncbi:unnamed protein product [Chondrus crispus]|uniref:Uncharacterized protein n=1 Tax=Chondrus crispus TaxID=2769 RepID=R7QHK9_CHOCR|nr:unnamed protein product [Chondrus crispus]CDF36956.1 unnamed protein product [Chondrus crispus]|eukprot:XP_005716775.1 unnamed protein product [Chondrus crispus]
MKREKTFIEGDISAIAKILSKAYHQHQRHRSVRPHQGPGHLAHRRQRQRRRRPGHARAPPVLLLHRHQPGPQGRTSRSLTRLALPCNLHPSPPPIRPAKISSASSR